MDDWDENPVWVTPPELQGTIFIERARNDIGDLRSSAFPHSHRQPGTSSWQRLRYPIDPMIWYLFWVNLDWFISTSPEEPRPLYIHAIVYTPVDPVQSVRKVIYRLNYQLFPPTVYTCLTHVKYRIRFRQAGVVKSLISVNNIQVLRGSRKIFRSRVTKSNFLNSHSPFVALCKRTST